MVADIFEGFEPPSKKFLAKYVLLTIYQISPSPLLNFVAQSFAFQVKLHHHIIIQYGYETFQNVKPSIENRIAKNI